MRGLQLPQVELITYHGSQTNYRFKSDAIKEVKRKISKSMAKFSKYFI